MRNNSLFVFRHTEPVGIDPGTVALIVGFFADEAHLGSNPLAFTHLELIITGVE